jgi:protein-L-isoaspartate O-methyltransferase
MESLSAALAAAEDRLRARGLTGAQAFDALEHALRHRLGDEVEVAPELLQVVQQLPDELGTAGVDLLGLAYERFFADLFKGLRGQYFTPPPIARLLTAVVELSPGEDVLDPTCGSGGLLVHAARAGARVRGMELDPRLAALSGLHLRLAGVDGHVRQADFFAAEPEPADVVVANPPFSVEITDPDVLARYELGVGQGRVLSDHLFVEALERWVRPSGRAAVVLPFSVLTNPSSAGLRARLDASWQRLATCALPEGVFRPFGGAAGRACLLWLRRRSPASLPLAAPSRWATVDDPGYDVRLQRLKPTSPVEVDQLIGGGRWRMLPAGCWVPRARPLEGRPVSELASLRAERLTPAQEPEQQVALADLADADRATGELHPRLMEGARVRGARARIEPGDVLVARLRPELGNVALATAPPEHRGPLVGSTEWVVLEVPRFRNWVLHAMRSPAWRAQLPVAGGQTRPRTSAAAVLASRVPFPGEALAERVDQLSAALLAERAVLRAQLASLQAAVDGFAAGQLDAAALAAAVAAIEETRRSS